MVCVIAPLPEHENRLSNIEYKLALYLFLHILFCYDDLGGPLVVKTRNSRP